MARKRFIAPSCVLHGVHVASANLRRYTKISASEEKTVIVPHAKPSYYTRCWGKLIQITEMQAAILRPTGNVIIR